LKWIKQNRISLFLFLGYLIYDNFHMLFEGVEITWFKTNWDVQDYVYKFGDYIFSSSLLTLIIIFFILPKNTDDRVLILALILVNIKDLLGRLLEFIGYNIDFFNNEAYNLGWIYKFALPVFCIMICYWGRYIGRKWILRYG